MIKNYISIALRNIKQNKIYSFINIAGLTIGLTACLLVATVVVDDLSYDRHWKKAADIYRLVSIDNSNKNAESKDALITSGLGPTIKNLFPGVAGYCRMSTSSERIKLGFDKDGVAIKALSTESNAFDLFDFKITQGNPHRYVKGYVNLVISQKIKDQYFPKTDPVGKLVYTVPDFGKSQAYLITGIIEDIPSNTHLRADVIEIAEYKAYDNELRKNGNGNYYQQYVLLKPGANVVSLTANINKWYHNFMLSTFPKTSFELQPISDVYLNSSFANAQRLQGSMRNVYIFSGVAILLLLIACINFINLTTARAIKRLREAGIRKVLGAGRAQLIGQFLTESLIFFLISFTFGILFYKIFIVWVEKFIGHPLALNLFSNTLLLCGTCGFVLLISLFTGLYPAFVLSGRNPIAAISGKSSINIGGGILRKGLVVAQFMIAVTVIISAFVIHDQLRFIDNKDLGFDKSNLLYLSFSNWEGKASAFKDDVLKLSGVEKASISNWAPGNGGGNMSMQLDDPFQKNSKLTVWYIEGDADLSATLKLQLKEGRLLDPKRSTDAVNSDSLQNLKQYEQIHTLQLAQPVMITEYTAKSLDIKQLNVKGSSFKEGTPVGILKTFNNESLHDAVKPTVVRAIKDPQYGYLLVRLNSAGNKKVVAGLQSLWHQYYPEKIFKITWVDEILRDQYKVEQKQQSLFSFFSLLIIFLACLGLFGLAAFTAEQRVKEIGIRKVLGASISGITALLSKEFLKLVFIAILVSTPIAWYAMNMWLQDFAYRITIQWWMFAIAGGVVLFIAFFTVSFQSVKAAMANPVKSLRSE